MLLVLRADRMLWSLIAVNAVSSFSEKSLLAVGAFVLFEGKESALLMVMEDRQRRCPRKRMVTEEM